MVDGVSIATPVPCGSWMLCYIALVGLYATNIPVNILLSAAVVVAWEVHIR